ncbi:Uncharacterized protein TCM_004026 [Theobroma cacao]|uniref:Uncharacterized protein n=1 Tax=Theobroma cacao TaxID=3641 RepID=A0A061DNP6_THECC|nr:Uncharacterized protein TCM_004026 [Theobroma cacao]
MSQVVLSTVYTYPPMSEKDVTSVKRLLFYDRILHLIVSYTLHPYSINYSTIKSEDFWAIRAIIDSVGINTRCDPPKQHVMHIKINEHAINKLGFVFVNNYCVCKETINDLEFVGNEDREDTFAKLDVAFSTNSSTHLSVSPSYPSMSTAFDNEQTYSQLLSFMESMDTPVVHWLDALEARTRSSFIANSFLRSNSLCFALNFHCLLEPLTWDIGCSLPLSCLIGLDGHILFMIIIAHLLDFF